MPSESSHTRATTASHPPPNLSEPLPCPRCNSTNTKFCYYNNYNLSQPRYFCKSCRRYWTHGGTLRDVPVGGGTRRSSSSSKRHKSFSASSSSSSSSVEMKQETTVKSDEGINVISGYESFESLLGEGAFLALGSGSVGLDYGFGYGLGYGLEEMDLGYSECFGASGGGEIPVMDGCGDTWQTGEIEGKSGDSLIWPGLEISMQGNNVK